MIPQLFFSLETVYQVRRLYFFSRCLETFPSLSTDISAAKHADLLFVKAKPGGDNDLAAYCTREGITHVLFEDFSQVLPVVQHVVSGKKTVTDVIRGA